MANKVQQHVEPPGFFIKEELKARRWSQQDLAFLLGIGTTQLSKILSGTNSISGEMANKLSAAFNMSPEFFANLDQQYVLSRAPEPPASIANRAKWQTFYPIREMIERKWITDEDPTLLDMQLLRFFEKNRIEDIPFISENENTPNFAAKKTNQSDTLPAELAWLYRVRKIAETITVPSYNEHSLREKLRLFSTLLIDPSATSSVAEHLAECGVRFLVVETLKKAKICGVCTWVKDQPVIAVTNRLDRLDNFWFVLRHEIEHVLQGHGKDDETVHIDSMDCDRVSEDDRIDEEEKAANFAATEFCLPSVQLDSFIARKGQYVSEKDIIGFSRRLEIHPAIVVGQYQFRTKRWSFLRKYLVGVREHLLSGMSGTNQIDGWGNAAIAEL